MAIALCAFVLASFLGFGTLDPFSLSNSHSRVCQVMRQMLIHENKLMEQEEQMLTEAQRERIEKAASLEGISFEEAVRRRKGFRYLY